MAKCARKTIYVGHGLIIIWWARKLDDNATAKNKNNKNKYVI